MKLRFPTHRLDGHKDSGPCPGSLLWDKDWVLDKDCPHVSPSQHLTPLSMYHIISSSLSFALFSSVNVWMFFYRLTVTTKQPGFLPFRGKHQGDRSCGLNKVSV